MEERTAVPARIIAKRKICFREAATIKKIADSYNSTVTIIKGRDSATSDSILSLVLLQIKEGDSFLVTAQGENPDTAVMKIMHLLLNID